VNGPRSETVPAVAIAHSGSVANGAPRDPNRRAAHSRNGRMGNMKSSSSREDPTGRVKIPIVTAVRPTRTTLTSAIRAAFGH
jgi:hypothetical protein